MKKAKASNCKYFKSCGNVFGGCKHPDRKGACLEIYIDDCTYSERKYKLKSIEKEQH